MFNPDKYVPRVERMWLQIARTLEKKAVERAEMGFETLAVKTARLAAACLWEATGEGECATLTHLMEETNQ